MVQDESLSDVLVDLLNTKPVIDGETRDLLKSEQAARTWLKDHGGTGNRAEIASLRRLRDELQDVVQGDAPARTLEHYLDGVIQRPVVTEKGIEWSVASEPAGTRLTTTLTLEWGRLLRERPGRLRACANEECNLFLLDRTKGGTARWCSMKTCGNRLKARRHNARQHAESSPHD